MLGDMEKWRVGNMKCKPQEGENRGGCAAHLLFLSDPHLSLPSFCSKNSPFFPGNDSMCSQG